MPQMIFRITTLLDFNVQFSTKIISHMKKQENMIYSIEKKINQWKPSLRAMVGLLDKGFKNLYLKDAQRPKDMGKVKAVMYEQNGNISKR